MKFDKYFKIALASSILASGCSAPVTRIAQKDNFSAETKVYVIPRDKAYVADEQGLTIKERAGEYGIDGYGYSEDFMIKKDYSDSTGLANKIKEIKEAYETKVTNKYFADKKPSEQATKPILTTKPKSLEAKAKTAVKSKTQWYNNKWFQILAPTIIMAGAYVIYNQNNKSNNEKTQQVYGGRTEQESDIGGVRGSRTDNSEAGGNR